MHYNDYVICSSRHKTLLDALHFIAEPHSLESLNNHVLEIKRAARGFQTCNIKDNVERLTFSYIFFAFKAKLDLFKSD